MLVRVYITLLLLLLLASSSAIAQTDVPEYQLFWRIQRESGYIYYYQSEEFAFSPDGSYFAATDSEFTVGVWDIEAQQRIYSLDYPPPPAYGTGIAAVSWSPDGTMIAAGTYGRIIRLWNADTGALIQDLPESSGYYHSWSPDSTRLATDYMKIIDAQTGTVLIELAENWSPPYHPIWSPDGSLIATPSGWEGDVLNLWTAEGERFDTYWAGTTASWSPDSTRLATSGQIREVSTGLPVVIIPEMHDIIAWHPDGEWIASTQNLRTETEDTIYLWDANTGELITSWQLTNCSLHGFVWSPDGNRFAVNCVQWLISDSLFQLTLQIWERVQ
jgi:WD40 repeat protein